MATINFATSQKISEWQDSKEREGGGLCLWVQCCPALLEQCQTTGESNRGLISHRMHCQSCRGLCSKWELVHYGAAARYFTTDLDVGEDAGLDLCISSPLFLM